MKVSDIASEMSEKFRKQFEPCPIILQMLYVSMQSTTGRLFSVELVRKTRYTDADLLMNQDTPIYLVSYFRFVHYSRKKKSDYTTSTYVTY